MGVMARVMAGVVAGAVIWLAAGIVARAVIWFAAGAVIWLAAGVMARVAPSCCFCARWSGGWHLRNRHAFASAHVLVSRHSCVHAFVAAAI
jgi:hypothetical protein